MSSIWNKSRKLRFLLMIFLLCDVGSGCYGIAKPTITGIVNLNPQSKDFVVIVESIETKVQIDSGSPDSSHVLASFVAIPRKEQDEICLEVPEMQTAGFIIGWFFWHKETRWTFYTPGFMALTVYPRTMVDKIPGTSGLVTYARMGWSRDAQHRMNPWGYRIFGPYDPSTSRVFMSFPLRGAHYLIAPQSKPSWDPTGPFPPPDATVSDAWNFAEQLESLDNLLARAPKEKWNENTKEIILRSIADEYKCLEVAGFGNIVSRKYECVVRKLRL